MPDWRRWADRLTKGNQSHIVGIRRERIFFWNTRLHKWDELARKVWLKDETGNETPISETTHRGHINDDTL